MESRQVAEALKPARSTAQAPQHCLCVLDEASAGVPAAAGSQAEPVLAPAWLLSACLLVLVRCLLPSLRAEDCPLQGLEAPSPLPLSAQEQRCCLPAESN